MKYSFFKINNQNQKFDFDLQVIKGKIQSSISFNFPTENFPLNQHNKGLIKILEHIDFSSIDNTIKQLETINFMLIKSIDIDTEEVEPTEQKVNYVKIWLNMYELFVNIPYLIKDKEAAMLCTCLRGMTETEVTQLFNKFFISNEWWANVKSISNFVDKINQVRLIIANPIKTALAKKFPEAPSQEYENSLKSPSEVNEYRKHFFTDLGWTVEIDSTGNIPIKKYHPPKKP